jgi:uncharacterized membrane protein
MKRKEKLLRGMLLGAGAMYFLDPDRGARRRSLVRDQLVHAGHKVGHGMSSTARDTRNRAAGAVVELKSRLHEESVDDTVLHERVRSAIGRVVSHPGSISVTAFEGRITLSGQVLAEEVDNLIRQVKQVRGVREVRNEMEMHRAAGRVSSLQGQGHRPREASSLEKWPSPIRLVLGAVSSLVALKGFRGRGLAGNALAGAGVGLMTRVAERPLAAILRGRSPATAIEVQETIQVNAPLEQVWETWSNFEHFPRFMSHLREVRRTYKNRSHWVAAGPAGMPVEWDAIVTEWVPNEAIAWKSVEGSTVETAGRVSLRPIHNGGIRIDVRMSYIPPGGALGHAVAALFGADPQHAIEEDLFRLKSLLEQGNVAELGLSQRASSAPASGSPWPEPHRAPGTRQSGRSRGG